MMIAMTKIIKIIKIITTIITTIMVVCWEMNHESVADLASLLHIMLLCSTGSHLNPELLHQTVHLRS